MDVSRRKERKDEEDIEECFVTSYLSNELRFRVLKNDNRTDKGWIGGL